MSNTTTEGVSLAGDTNETENRASIASVVGRLVHAINELLPPGDVAELRRLDIHDPSSPVFFKLLIVSVEPHVALPTAGEPRDRAEQRWAAVLRGLAAMKDLHRPGRPLGKALAEAGLSELRLVRLLRVRGDTLFDEVRACVNYLASKNEGCNLTDVAKLVLLTDPQRAERHRRSIARAYYRQQSRIEKEKQHV